MSTPSLAVRLLVEPARISQNSELNIRGDVRNTGDAVVDTRIYASVLLVDGKPSENWPLAIGNGIGDERASALPPGERIEFHRTLPASSVLRQRGLHEVVLIVEGVCSPPATVQWQ
ncbi:MAG: hypothetical protein WA419_22075 [Silvibacterium sp.]